MVRDDELENAIDEAGRDRVFALVGHWGWPFGSNPPKYVWWEAVRIVNSHKPATAA